jgi:transcriptional regulator with XRE-family HTH domain
MYPNLKLKLWTTGLRQNRLAQMLGMDETMLSKAINGFREITPEVRRKIAELLETDEGWLFETEITLTLPKSHERKSSLK